MRYAITGATGFIGTALSNRLASEGHSVTPVPRASLESAVRFAHFIDWASPDVIVHCAAYGNHYSQKDRDETVKVNTIATLNVFLGAGNRPVYNFTSSSITLATQTAYSVTKKAAADIATLYPNVINIMPYSVYGPGEAAHRFIPTVINSLLTGNWMQLDETATHDWIFVDSFIDMFLSGYKEIGTGIKTSNLDVVKMLEEITGKKLNYQPVKNLRAYDNDNWVCDIKRYSGVSLYDGLVKTVKHYK